MYDLTGKTILITGASAGIGKSAAIQLAQAGAHIAILCRSAERGGQALNEIRSAGSGAPAELILADLGSQREIHAAAEEFKAQHQHLDVLIHNAANFDLTLRRPVLTEDGLETIFATNHIAPFLLTHLLMDTLKSSSPSRIITVASKGLAVHPLMDIEFDNLNGERKFSPEHAYYLSKQAQVMFTFTLARMLAGTGVTVNCVRVGNVAVPDERISHLPKMLQKMYSLKRKFAITPEKMAETYVWLAGDPGLENVTGGYFDSPNVPVRANPNAYNRETWKRLWEVSERLSTLQTSTLVA